MIAIDYTPAYEQGAGIGRYVRELTAALMRVDEQTNYTLFVAGTTHIDTPVPQNFRWKTSRLAPVNLARLWHRLHIPLPIELFTGKVELFHATDFVLPPMRAKASILTVHDLSFVKVPETTSPALKRYLDNVVPKSIKRATHVLADSQATKDDMVNIYGTPADKITVLYSGVDQRFAHDASQNNTIRTKYKIPQDRPYIFSVGTVQPRKNYARLIQSLAQLRAKGHDVCLVIAGGKGWLDDPIYESIQSSSMRDYVHMIGFADDSDLPGLYSSAICTAFPSLYEGFGLPILESMACGTPVVTSNVSSLPEVAGDAGLTINPYDLDELTNALEQLITDVELRDMLIAKGYQQAASFTWERAARELISIYQRII